MSSRVIWLQDDREREGEMFHFDDQKGHFISNELVLDFI